MNQFKAVLITAPAGLRERLEPLMTVRLIDACCGLSANDELTLEATVHSTLRTLATRWRVLNAEALTQHKLLVRLVQAHAPKLLAEPGVGPDTAATLLITAGDNLHRLHSGAAFAALCGAGPIPASSGKTDLHRLMHHEETRTYMAAHPPRTGATRCTSCAASSATSRAASTR